MKERGLTWVADAILKPPSYRGFKMQSFENKPVSKRPGLNLNVDTSRDIGKGKDISPPQTPKMENYRPNRGNIVSAKRALKVRTGLRGDRETFLDDITPVDPAANKENDPERGRIDHRDSHDLSLSPRQVTRDSLVDHMLLSLDQFSFGQDDGFGRQPTVDEEQLYNTFEEETYQPTSNFAPRNPRGVGHSYSYSSDYDNADDSSRYSGGQLSRGRRSNSSSNFQTSLSRINSKRGDINSSFSSGRQNGPQVPPRGIHSRSGKGSKGSSANSFDLGYAQVTSSTRWAHGLAGRSSSFDYGSDRMAMNPPPPPSMTRQMDTGASNINPYDYDAAPTPTVPVGPRRPPPTSPIVLPPESPRIDAGPQKLERKRSTRSSKSGYKGKLSSNMSSGGRLDYGLQDPAQPLPPMPAFMKESAPAPLVGYGKTKEVPAGPPKEKPGFFRRVFGSRNTPASAQEPPPSHGSTTSAETTDRPSSRPHIGNQIKSHQTQQPPPPPPPKEHSHVLTKKPSSFFRRRKKSVSEAEAPMPPIVPPLALQPDKDPAAGKPQASPVSSLRKVMNPYLRTPARSPVDPFPQASIDREMNHSPEPIERSIRGFSPEYTPDKNATIKAVRPNRESLDNITSSRAVAQKPLLSSPDAPSRNDSRSDRDVTFLQDASDNDRDGSSISGTDKDLLEPNQLPSRQHNSPSVARDIALVAEYERTHSRRSPTPSKTDQAKSSPIGNPPPKELGSGIKHTIVTTRDEDWVMLTPTKSPNGVDDKEHRVWLEPSSSEEDLSPPAALLKAGDTPGRFSGSTDTAYKSATSLPLVQVDGEEVPETPERHLMSASEAVKTLDEVYPSAYSVVPAEGDRERAKKIYDGNEDFIQKEKAAAWLGEEGPIRLRTLLAYMELYEFANLNILAAFRMMCARLVLKAESQQVDRILVAFSKRWCECNPDHGFKGNGTLV